MARDINGRIGELASLKSGWLDGEGSEISPVSVESVRALVSALPFLGRVASLFPTRDGELQFECPEHGFEVLLQKDGKAEISYSGSLLEEGYPEEADPVELPLAITLIRAAYLGWPAHMENPRDHSSGKSRRLEGLLRRIVMDPVFKNEGLAPALLHDLARELPLELHQSKPETLSLGEILLTYDGEAVFAMASHHGRSGIFSRVEEAETGFPYFASFPSPDNMARLKRGEIDLRSAILDVDTDNFLCDWPAPSGRVAAAPASGVPDQACLPDEGFFLTSLTTFCEEDVDVHHG